jgi:hypothetical protein
MPCWAPWVPEWATHLLYSTSLSPSLMYRLRPFLKVELQRGGACMWNGLQGMKR